MKTLVLPLSIFVAVTIASAEPLVVVVRRAEKAASDQKDPDLSPAGRARAEALARILKDSGIRTIFTTEFKRTQETAAPTATSAHVTPTVVAGERYGRARREVASAKRQRAGCWTWRYDSEYHQSAWNQCPGQHP